MLFQKRKFDKGSYKACKLSYTTLISLILQPNAFYEMNTFYFISNKGKSVNHNTAM